MFYSDFIINILLGEKWSSVAELLPYFSLISFFLGVGGISSSLIKASGQGKLLFKFSIFNTVVLLTCFIFGLRYGIYGVTVSYLIGVVISFICLSFLAGKIVDIAIIHQSEIWIKSSLPLILAGILSKSIVDRYESDWSQFIGIMVVLLFSYLYSYFFKREEAVLFNRVFLRWYNNRALGDGIRSDQ